LRGPEFVTRKISLGAARIKLGRQASIQLGNLDSTRDWGYAGEFVEGMWRMLQADAPDTFVLATGVTTRVRDFAVQAFKAAGIDLGWRATPTSEEGYCQASKRVVVTIDPGLKRPAEVEALIGDCGKATRLLGWKPVLTVEQLARRMVMADLARERVAAHAERLTQLDTSTLYKDDDAADLSVMMGLDQSAAALQVPHMNGLTNQIRPDIAIRS